MRSVAYLCSAALAAWCLAGPAAAQPFEVKIGVLNDMSSLYQDTTGPGSVVAAKMAVEDYLKEHPNTALKPSIVSADHQNKPDIGAQIAREWFQIGGVDVIVDVPNSGVALAVSDVAKQLNKVHVNNSAGTTRLTGDLCNANTLHWSYDNYALANGTGSAVVAGGGDSWFFITADYAFGQDLEAQTTAVVKKSGGKVLGSVKVPLNNADFSSFLLQAQGSGAKVVGLANAGGDTINSIKQAAEFGLTQKQKLAGMLVYITDIHSLGLPIAQGLLFTEPFYWDRTDESRAWTARFIKQHKDYPTSNQVAVYSSILHILKAEEIAKTRDGKKLVEQMKAMPSDDVIYGKGSVREDGLHIHPMYLLQAKTPAESKSEWDLMKIAKEIPADRAWMPLSESACPLVAKKS